MDSSIREESDVRILKFGGIVDLWVVELVVGAPEEVGAVEVDGEVVMVPQFNSHLTEEMTAEEHFKLFGHIYGIDGTEARQRFVTELGLEEHVLKPVRTLSGGNARKLAIAVAMMSPAEVVLLDEPTASLDPVARHCVRDMINSFRGEKTMILCTHLLNEAEELCDSIAMMLKGSIYVVGSPAYLSDKFGTEWRMDVLFSQPSDGRLGQVLRERVPGAKLIVSRPTNEIYGIPSDQIPIADLFKFMEKIVGDGKLGVKFFTVSSATLEKAFVELVQQSEAAALIQAEEPMP
jgi:ABC-type multidrug transport system ATPase subunit